MEQSKAANKQRTLSSGSWFLILFAVLALLCVSALAQAPADQFTIIALPDTQFYSESYPQIFTTNMQWVANNATAMNIKYVAGLGDIVEVGNSDTEWQNADSAVKVLDQAGIPYGMVIGNHDYDVSAMDDSARETVYFDKYFGPSRYAAYSWYGASSYPTGSNANFYSVVNVNGVNYLFLYLEFYPRDAALQWAASVLQANPDKKVIVVTHGYENSTNYRMGACDISGPVSYNLANDNDGDMMWTKLISQYANIIMVLSGHMTNAGHEVDFGVNGNLVNQMMSGHYPNDPNDGNGYLRMITITPSQNRIDVQTYSPFANLYKTDSANQFSLSFQSPPMGTVAGEAAIRGNIHNSGCAAITGATVSYHSTTTTTSGSVTVDSFGYYSTPVTSPDIYTVTAAANGYVSASTSVQVEDGYAVPARFVLVKPPPDFALSASPSSQTVTQGGNTSYTATTTAVYGFTGAVAFAASGLPSGATANFSPTSVSGSGSTALAISASASTPAGTYPITITGTSGTLQHTAQATLVVSSAIPDFTISSSPSSQTITQGGSTSYTATVTALTGFSGVVKIAAKGLPSGATASFSPTSVTGSGTSTLSIYSAAKTAPGNYTVTITATSGTLGHTVTVGLGIQGFTLSASPNSRKVHRGSGVSYMATVTALDGFSDTETISVDGLPFGATASFTPASVSGSGTSTMSVVTSASTPTGTYPLTIKATGTSVNLYHTAAVTLSVQ